MLAISAQIGLIHAFDLSVAHYAAARTASETDIQYQVYTEQPP